MSTSPFSSSARRVPAEAICPIDDALEWGKGSGLPGVRTGENSLLAGDQDSTLVGAAAANHSVPPTRTAHGSWASHASCQFGIDDDGHRHDEVGHRQLVELIERRLEGVIVDHRELFGLDEGSRRHCTAGKPPAAKWRGRNDI